MILGYARVSTEGQTLDGQIAELKSVGCERIFQEKVSGARSDRKELAKLTAKLKTGDTLIVTRLDRLARSSRDLLNILHVLSEKGVAFRSLGDQWADTTTPHGRLMLTVLGGLAEFERSLIKVRTGEGRKRAMAEGVRFGRKPKLTPYQKAEVIRRRASGETTTQLARSFGVSHATVSRMTAGI
jgi:DNA invertase Pin-like site-specific DNA recombinase